MDTGYCMINLVPGQLRFFYGTTPQTCPYLPDKIETKAITELKGKDASYLHDLLSQAGFRRSHSLAYKPACPGCNACIPARVRVSEFKLSKSMRRILQKNSELVFLEKTAKATEEQFLLFKNYENIRHTNGEMAAMDFNDFKAMVEGSPVETMITEYRDKNGDLLAVALTDKLCDGLSGVYTFFSPAHPKLSLGTFLILSQIFKARELCLSYFYLGYWIQESPKMAYKGRFLPMEILTRSGWIDHKP
jgi:arginyl-tRNA--protein-N-Asp/Glu arginylyltransferase